MNTVAYLIQAYSDYTAFKNLCTTLLNMNNCEIFVHLDKKSDIDKFYISDVRVHFISNREFVSWAGYKQGKLIMNLIDAAVAYATRFDRYVFLSESDFPTKNNQNLYDSIVNSSTIVLNCSQNQSWKVEKYWFYDFNIKSVFWNKVVSKVLNTCSEVLYKARILKKQSKVMINGELVDIYCSGPFWQYSYDQILYIDECFKKNKSIEKYFKYSFAACELIVPTIIANSKYNKECIFRDRYKNLEDLSALCYFKYNGSRVSALCESDYRDVIKSGKPFIRKVNNKSEKLVELIKNEWK